VHNTDAHGRPQNFSHGRQRQHFAYSFQVAEDAMQLDVQKRFTFSAPQIKCPVLRQQSQKCALCGHKNAATKTATKMRFQACGL